MVAADYEAAFGEDLVELDLDRAMLDAAVEGLPAEVPVLDLGSGTGSAARYLWTRGHGRIVGLDLSLGMLRTAPPIAGLQAVQGDMRAVPIASGTFGAVVAFYSLHHLARRDLPTALAEAKRVLRPGGRFLLATHLGARPVVTSEFLGHRVEAIGANLYTVQELTTEVERAGLEPSAARTREPLAHEYPSERVYLLARR